MRAEQQPREQSSTVEKVADLFPPPVLIISTAAGKGAVSVGEAFAERLGREEEPTHLSIEELLPPDAVREDLARYRLIAQRFRSLLYLVYKLPVFYLRKYWRERVFRGADLTRLRAAVAEVAPKTVICISHRPTFWLSALKRREGLTFQLWSVLVEYGSNLGYKYLFWDEVDGLLSPVEKKQLGFDLASGVSFRQIALPAKREYHALGTVPGHRENLLLVGGYWGIGPIIEVARAITDALPQLRLHIACGDNQELHRRLEQLYVGNGNVILHRELPSLAPILRECASIITKPGVAALLEAEAAGRKIFLIRGLPVAEDHNARHAVAELGAEWFSVARLRRWCEC